MSATTAGAILTPDPSKTLQLSQPSIAGDRIYLRALLVGFAIVAFLILVISGYALFSTRQIIHDIDEILDVHGHHIRLLRELELISQKRARLHFELTHIKDPFDRDSKIQEISEEARKFIIIFTSLNQIKHVLPAQSQMMSELSQHANAAQAQFQIAADLAVSGKIEAANRQILTRSLLAQSKVLSSISDQINFHQSEMLDHHGHALLRGQQQQHVLIVGGMLALVISLAIGWRVWWLMKRMVGDLQNSQNVLKESVRAMEYQQIAMNEHAIVSITDPSGKIIFVNKKFTEISQYSEAELIGQNHRILNSHFHSKSFFREMWHTIAKGKVWQGTLRNQRKDGSIYWVQSTIVPFLDELGRPYQYASIRTDITPLIAAEEAVRDEAVFTRSVINNMSGGVITLNGQGFISTFNKAAAHIFGYTESEISGQPFSKLVPPSLNIDTDYFTSGSINCEPGCTGCTSVLYAMKKDSSVFPVELTFSEITYKHESIFVCLVMDISLRRKAEEAMILARDEAQRASSAKTRFLSSMSHELRTPMNAILGYTQLLSMDSSLHPQHKEFVRQIALSGDHLLRLINDILDLARIESGRIDLAMENVALCPLINECMKMVETQAHNNEISLNEICPIETHIFADRMRLKQALINLLSNAIKYNHRGGSVSLAVSASENGMINIMVSDTGNGIPENRLSELFQPFNRLGAESGSIEGSGIGLSITRSIVEQMGGNIGVNSKLGSGSNFWIELLQAPIPVVH